jgi:hypothetical protein
MAAACGAPPGSADPNEAEFPVTASTVIVNGGFETGNLSGWATTGTAAVSKTPHSGVYSLELGSTDPSNDSTAAQSFVAPSGTNEITFWYRSDCGLPYTTWAFATLVDKTSGSTRKVLNGACSDDGVWRQVSAPLKAGDKYMLTLGNHDDDGGVTPTHTFFDDVSIVASAPNAIVNGGFELNGLSSWKVSGKASAVLGGHSGSYAAQVGEVVATDGDSAIEQSFTAPANSHELSFYYSVICTDTIEFDWATATLLDKTTNKTTTVLPKVCNDVGKWEKVTTSIVAGHAYTLELINHDDNSSDDPTFTLFDDVHTD